MSLHWFVIIKPFIFIILLMFEKGNQVYMGLVYVIFGLLLRGQDIKIAVVPNNFEQLLHPSGHLVWHIFAR